MEIRMKSARTFLCLVVCGLIMTLCSCAPAPTEAASTELVILSTTDMHGKCWEKNLLTGKDEPQNMLRVSTVVQEMRDTYGTDNVIAIDNGDLYQGTPVSEVHLTDDGGTGEDEAMSVCLKEIGYDAFVLGNHEFNYPWDRMRSVYEDLGNGGVDVLAANAYWDGTDGTHEAGENVFDAFTIREVLVGGHPHKVGILGIGNTDISRWDLPVRYPSIVFTHPDNPSYDMAKEANRYISQMREEGCEMIIVSYHAGLGLDEAEPEFGVTTEDQGAWVVKNTDSLDLLVLGHDHSKAYSNAFVTDKAGRGVPVVNGGTQDVSKTVFRLSEDERGALVCELVSTENVDLSDYEPDAALEEKIRPYAEQADAKMDEPIGKLSGQWDGSSDYYRHQTDAMDLVLASMIGVGSQRMASKYEGKGFETLGERGIDHTDVDAAIMSGGAYRYIPQSGEVSKKDVYNMFGYANSLYVIPMTGQELLDVMEENAKERLSARVLNGEPYFFTKNDIFTHLIFGGLNFTYDMSQPAGKRVLVEGIENGRPFDVDKTYLVAVLSYILGNNGCGLRKWSNADALWSQVADDAGGAIQDCIQEFITEQTEKSGSVTADMMGWEWSVAWLGDLASQLSHTSPVSATLADVPEDGCRYVLYCEAQGCGATNEVDESGALVAQELEACGNDLVGTLPDEVAVFTVHAVGEDTIMLSDENGRYLACGKNGGATLTGQVTDDDRSVWQLIEAKPGYHIQSSGAMDGQAIEYASGKITTHALGRSDMYLFNFYELGDQ